MRSIRGTFFNVISEAVPYARGLKSISEMALNVCNYYIIAFGMAATHKSFQITNFDFN